MQVLVIANEELKTELLQDTADKNVQIEWLNDTADYTPQLSYAACIDLLFENKKERIDWLKNGAFDVVIVNSVMHTLAETHTGFVRFNGWPTFLSRPVMEASALNEGAKIKATAVFNAFNKKPEWVPDVTGLITPRVVCSIINEAWFALEENVSTAMDIDTAMKLGTNYPFGPFEWSEKIGHSNVVALLQMLAASEDRYTPSSLLLKTASR